MSVVQDQWQQEVVRIGFPLTSAANRNVMDSNGFSRSFPILAVTRSKTLPYFTVSGGPDVRQSTSGEKQTKPIIRSSLSFTKRSTNGNADISKTTPEKNAQSHERRRASSLPVWPVTNLTTISKMSENVDKTLPKPKLNVDWVGWKQKRRISVQNGPSKEGAPVNGYKASRSAKLENRKLMVRIKPPSRSCTPMSEYDPDKLSIKQVVQFLDTHAEDHPRRPQSFKEELAGRPRPYTVAHTDGKYGCYINAASPSSGPKGRIRRSPIAARRYMRSARSQEPKDRSLSTSPLGISERRVVSRREVKFNKKISTLASIAARYNPNRKTEGAASPEKENEESLLSYRDNGSISSEQHFGPLKYQSATFQSFPTNQVSDEIVEVTINGRTDDATELAEDGDNNVDVNQSHESTPPFSNINISTFNAVNAIRLPSVFDNVDGDSENGWAAGNSGLTKQFELLTVSGTVDQEQEPPSPENTSRSSASRPTSREKNRHNRNLSLVLSREKSSDRSSSPERKYKYRQTGNWVRSCADDHRGKVIELKLTHGSLQT